MKKITWYDLLEDKKEEKEKDDDTVLLSGRRISSRIANDVKRVIQHFTETKTGNISKEREKQWKNLEREVMRMHTQRRDNKIERRSSSLPRRDIHPHLPVMIADYALEHFDALAHMVMRERMMDEINIR